MPAYRITEEAGILACRGCCLYPPCWGYCTSADPETSGPAQMDDHLTRHEREAHDHDPG